MSTIFLLSQHPKNHKIYVYIIFYKFLKFYVFTYTYVLLHFIFQQLILNKISYFMALKYTHTHTHTHTHLPPSYIQPEGNSKKPKHVVKSC
jgi:hypothetical protein